MSWALAYSQCWVLTGIQHVSQEKFASTMADSYHQCVKRHIDLISSGTLSFIPDSKRDELYKGILSICNQNFSPGEKNFLQQIGVHILKYWEGIEITGPYGIIVVEYTGVWLAPWIKQNFNFSIILALFILVARIHLMTLVGTFTSALKNQKGQPLIIAPWVGASMQTFG